MMMRFNFEYPNNLIEYHEQFNPRYFNSILKNINHEITQRIEYLRFKTSKERPLKNDEDLNLIEDKKDKILKIIELSLFDIPGLYDELFPHLNRMNNLTIDTISYYRTEYQHFIPVYSKGYNLIEIITPMHMSEYSRRKKCYFQPDVLCKDSIVENVKIIEKVEPYRDQISSKITELINQMKQLVYVPHWFYKIIMKIYYYRLFYYPYVTDKLFVGTDENFLDFIVNENGLLERVCSEFDYCDSYKDNMWYCQYDIPQKYLENQNCSDIGRKALKIFYNVLIFEKNVLPHGKHSERIGKLYFKNLDETP